MIVEKEIKNQNSDLKYSILIPTWNNIEYLKLCINSIRTNSHFEHQLIVHVNETRLNDGKGSWRRKGWSIVDRTLVNIIDHKRFNESSDFLTLIPKNLKMPFTNFKLSKALQKSIGLARKMTYCLRKTGLLKVIGKKGKALLFDISY